MGETAVLGDGPGPRLALIILDGLGDRPHPDTGGLSPVEAARTPNLDKLAARGALGSVTVIGRGVAPESDAGVLALLGYDPVRDSPGRGVLEALGIGMALEPGDVAFRLNFATLDNHGVVADARVGRSMSTAEARELAGVITDADLLGAAGIRAEVQATVGHRGVLRLHPTSGGSLSPQVSNSDPFYEKLGGMGRARRVTDPRPLLVRPLDRTREARRTADATNEFLQAASRILPGQLVNARRALSGRKLANGLLVRNAGALPTIGGLVPFATKHGFSGAAVTEMPVERGIARLLGLADKYVGPMGADRDAALKVRARVTLEALREHPFAYVHLKGPDEPGHDGNAQAKREIIEQLDASFFGPFLERADWAKLRVAVTADHATPCILKGHADDPVPLVLSGAGVAAAPTPPGGLKFGELAAAAGTLGLMRGTDVLPTLIRGARPK